MSRERFEAEFDEYFSARAPALRRTAFLIVRDWHTAEDMVQATFVKLYLHWTRVRSDSMDPYVRRILVNQCISHLRRNKRESLTDTLPEHATETTDQGLDIGAALALLPARQRAIVALRFLDDLSVADVAAVLRIAEGTVKSQTSRALQTMRTHLPDLVLSEERPR